VIASFGRFRNPATYSASCRGGTSPQTHRRPGQSRARICAHAAQRRLVAGGSSWRRKLTAAGATTRSSTPTWRASALPVSELWLLKPTAFMNRSGVPVAAVANFYRIAPADILVVHDDIDLPPGVARLKQGGGHGGHNGLRDVIAHIGAGVLAPAAGGRSSGIQGPGVGRGARPAERGRAAGDRCGNGAGAGDRAGAAELGCAEGNALAPQPQCRRSRHRPRARCSDRNRNQRCVWLSHGGIDLSGAFLLSKMRRIDQSLAPDGQSLAEFIFTRNV
jgi:hypothetical protein